MKTFAANDMADDRVEDPALLDAPVSLIATERAELVTCSVTDDIKGCRYTESGTAIRLASGDRWRSNSGRR